MERNGTLIIESQYLTPVSVISALYKRSNIIFAGYERYRRSSFRNRCLIASANGIVSLSIPLESGRNQQGPLSGVRISNQYAWQLHHWRTLESAYCKAPWFDHYAPGLEEFYRRSYHFLMDWNIEILRWILSQLMIETSIEIREAERPEIAASGTVDLRDCILPKNYLEFPSKPYQQVFSERTAFLPNLSVIDLLFCTGKQARNYL